MASYKDILDALASPDPEHWRNSKVESKDPIKKRIKKLLTEGQPQPQIQNQRKLLTSKGGLIQVRSKRDEILQRTIDEPDEPLFECYEDYVAYMISDDHEFGEYSTFMSADSFKGATGKDLFESWATPVDSDEQDYYEYVNNLDSNERARFDRMYERTKREKEFNAQEREWQRKQMEDEDRKRYREREQKQYEQQYSQQQRSSIPHGESLHERISRNKSRLFQEFGLPNSASLDDVKKAYRQQMIQYHPDKAATKDEKTQKEYTEKAQQINESYKKLLKQDFL